MKIDVQAIHFDADQKLRDFIEGRVEKLGHFYDAIISSEVILKVDKAQAIENKITEIKIKVPGKELFAKKQCNSFEEGTDLAVEALRKQIAKAKEKSRG